MVTSEKEASMKMTECMSLAGRFKELAGKGLVDVKFYVRNLDEASTEQVCAEVNALYAAREGGKTQALDFGDSRRIQA